MLNELFVNLTIILIIKRNSEEQVIQYCEEVIDSHIFEGKVSELYFRYLL